MGGGNETTVTVVVLSSAIVQILSWLAFFYLPALMATSTPVVTHAFEIVLTAGMCYWLPAWGRPSPTAEPKPPTQ
jgi:hypothetical protein